MADSQHPSLQLLGTQRKRKSEGDQAKNGQSINQYVLHHQARLSTLIHTHTHKRMRTHTVTQNGAAFAKRHFIVLEGVCVCFFFYSFYYWFWIIKPLIFLWLCKWWAKSRERESHRGLSLLVIDSPILSGDTLQLKKERVQFTIQNEELQSHYIEYITILRDIFLTEGTLCENIDEIILG